MGALTCFSLCEVKKQKKQKQCKYDLCIKQSNVKKKLLLWIITVFFKDALFMFYGSPFGDGKQCKRNNKKYSRHFWLTHWLKCSCFIECDIIFCQKSKGAFRSLFSCHFTFEAWVDAPKKSQ